MHTHLRACCFFAAFCFEKTLFGFCNCEGFSNTAIFTSFTTSSTPSLLLLLLLLLPVLRTVALFPS